MKLNGNVSIVTGGANGIGRQIAITLAKEGSEVIIIDIKDEDGKRTEIELNEISKGKFINCDISKPVNIEKAFEQIKSEYESISVLVNCAGVANRTPTEDITEEEWDFVNNINLKSAFFMSREAVVMMKKGGKGKIVNVSSLRAHLSDGTHSVYAISKAGMEEMTRDFAVAYARDNICVNTVAPAYVLTPMTEHNLKNPEWLAWLYSKVPMRRLIEMEEIANAVLFFASDQSNGITGQCLAVDGGWEVNL